MSAFSRSGSASFGASASGAKASAKRSDSLAPSTTGMTSPGGVTGTFSAVSADGLIAACGVIAACGRSRGSGSPTSAEAVTISGAAGSPAGPQRPDELRSLAADDGHPDIRGARADHVEFRRRRLADVDDPAVGEGPAVVDPDDDRPAVGEVFDLDLGLEGQGRDGPPSSRWNRRARRWPSRRRDRTRPPCRIARRPRFRFRRSKPRRPRQMPGRTF